MMSRILLVYLFIVASTEGARIFRNPEPHLPAENLPSEQRGYVEVSSEESFFGPDAWRPVRDPEFSGRRRLAPSAVDLPLASSRNLRFVGQRSSAAEATPPPSSNTPSTTLRQSIALVANQLLQGSDVVESRTPEDSTSTSVGWPHDVRTPPKLRLQVQKLSDDEQGKKPIKDDPMGENFFPSRRHPPQHDSSTPGVTAPQMTATSKIGEQTATSLVDRETTSEKSPTTTSTTVNRKSTSVATTTISTSVTTPTTPTSVKWKISIPMNRPTRFPPRKPTTTTTSSPIPSLDDTSKPTKPSSIHSRPSTSPGGFTKPHSLPSKVSSWQPTTTTTLNPITTTSTLAVEKNKSIPSLTTAKLPVTTTTTSALPVTTISMPVVTTPPTPSMSTPPKKNHTSETLSKQKNTDISAKNSEAVDKDTLDQSNLTKVQITQATENDLNKEESVITTTPRPRRPISKRKKNKNRRRRPSKKPSTSQPLNGSELEVKESPQEGSPGSTASPLTTRIYNFIAREVMPSMSVGLLGLVVTAGLAGYFLLPSLGGLQRRSDATTDGLTVYGSGGAYGGQEDDGGIITSIFQNVMASVRNGEKEFERGPRRRRHITPTDEAENEVDAILQQNSNKLALTLLAVDATTESFAPNHSKSENDMKDHSTESTSGLDEASNLNSTTDISVEDEGAPTTEAIKDINPTQDLIPSYYWDGAYDDNPFSIMGIFRRVVDFKLKIGVSLLRATTEVIARYLEDVQKRLRDSDHHDWLRSLGSSVRRIGREIDSTIKDIKLISPSKRFVRRMRTKRHG